MKQLYFHLTQAQWGILKTIAEGRQPKPWGQNGTACDNMIQRGFVSRAKEGAWPRAFKLTARGKKLYEAIRESPPAAVRLKGTSSGLKP